MPKLQQFLDLLDRPGVREVVLQSNSQPSVRLDRGLRPVARQFLSTEHVLAIVEGSALERLLPRSNEPRQAATFEHGGRLFAAKVARFGERVQIRIAHTAMNRRPPPSREALPPATIEAALDPDELPLPPPPESSAAPAASQPEEDRTLERESDTDAATGMTSETPPTEPAAIEPMLGGDPRVASERGAHPSSPPSGSPFSADLGAHAAQPAPSPRPEALPGGSPEDDDELPAVLSVHFSPPASRSAKISHPPDPDPVSTRMDSIPAMLSTAPPVIASTHPESIPELTSNVIPVAELEPLDSPWTLRGPQLPDFSTLNGNHSIATLVAQARAAGASDLHVFSGQPARMRVRGDLETTGDPLPHDVVRQMLLPALTAAQLERLEDRGHVDAAIELPGAGRVRVNVCRQRAGLKGSLRLIPTHPGSLEELGLPDQLAGITGQQQGLVIITGPAGHGKSTTLAALVHLFSESRPFHVITIEEPIEVVHDVHRSVVSQREVGSHTHSFPQALRAALREDPDVIVVGEMRDAQTAEMVLTACQTGHLVLTTINAPTAQRAIERFIALFPTDHHGAVRTVLAGALKLVAAQRLLRRQDNSGMVPAVEIVTGGIALWTLIRDGKLFQLPALQRRGHQLGMVSFADAARALVERGLVSMAEASPLIPATPRPVPAPAPKEPASARLRDLVEKGGQ